MQGKQLTLCSLHYLFFLWSQSLQWKFQSTQFLQTCFFPVLHSHTQDARLFFFLSFPRLFAHMVFYEKEELSDQILAAYRENKLTY